MASTLQHIQQSQKNEDIQKWRYNSTDSWPWH